MIHEMKEYNKFRVLFDRYDTKSLKNYARLDQTKRFSAVHYHVFDTKTPSNRAVPHFD